MDFYNEYGNSFEITCDKIIFTMYTVIAFE